MAAKRKASAMLHKVNFIEHKIYFLFWRFPKKKKNYFCEWK